MERTNSEQPRPQEEKRNKSSNEPMQARGGGGGGGVRDLAAKKNWRGSAGDDDRGTTTTLRGRRGTGTPPYSHLRGPRARGEAASKSTGHRSARAVKASLPPKPFAIDAEVCAQRWMRRGLDPQRGGGGPDGGSVPRALGLAGGASARAGTAPALGWLPGGWSVCSRWGACSGGGDNEVGRPVSRTVAWTCPFPPKRRPGGSGLRSGGALVTPTGMPTQRVWLAGPAKRYHGLPSGK